MGQTTQHSLLSQRWKMLLIRHCIEGGPEVEPIGLPFWVIAIKMYVFVEWNLDKFVVMFGYVRTYHLAARSSGPICFIFEIRFRALIGNLLAATWKPTIGPCQPIAQSPTMSPSTSTYHVILLHHRTVCHIVIFHWSMD
jgi:hypothetical protein